MTSGAVLARFEGVSHTGKFRDISFDLHAGEVLCLVGTEGSGREAVLRVLFGMDAPTSGTVTIKGETVTSFSARAGVAAGIGYLPRERKVEGIVNGHERL